MDRILQTCRQVRSEMKAEATRTVNRLLDLIKKQWKLPQGLEFTLSPAWSELQHLTVHVSSSFFERSYRSTLKLPDSIMTVSPALFQLLGFWIDTITILIYDEPGEALEDIDTRSLHRFKRDVFGLTLRKVPEGCKGPMVFPNVRKISIDWRDSKFLEKSERAVNLPDNGPLMYRDPLVPTQWDYPAQGNYRVAITVDSPTRWRPLLTRDSKRFDSTSRRYEWSFFLAHE